MIFNIEVGMKKVTASLDSGLPADVTVTAGGQATFKVVVKDEGFPKEHTFQWFVNETAIEGATGDTYTRDTSGDRGVISVWCEVTNKAGAAVSRRATLTVNKLPVLNASYPADASVLIARETTFSVSIAEHGYPTNYMYQWYVNGEAVSGATGTSYTHTRLSIGSDSIYCVVKNSVGSVNSRTATMTTTEEYILEKGHFVNGSGYHINGSSGISNVELVWNKDTEALRVTGDGDGFAIFYSTEPVSFDRRYKLVFHIRESHRHESTTNSTFYFGASKTPEDTSFAAYTAVEACTRDEWEYEVDITQLVGEYYIKAGMIRDSYYQDWFDIADIYFA